MDLVLDTKDSSSARLALRKYTKQVAWRDLIFAAVLGLSVLDTFLLVQGRDLLFWVSAAFCGLYSFCLLVIHLFSFAVAWTQRLGTATLAGLLFARCFQISLWFAELAVLPGYILILVFFSAPEAEGEHEWFVVNRKEGLVLMIYEICIILLLYFLVLGPSIMYIRAAAHLRWLLAREQKEALLRSSAGMPVGEAAPLLCAAVSESRRERCIGQGERDLITSLDEEEGEAGSVQQLGEAMVGTAVEEAVAEEAVAEEAVAEEAVAEEAMEEAIEEPVASVELAAADKAAADKAAYEEYVRSKSVVNDQGHVEWYNVKVCTWELLQTYAREKELPLCTDEYDENCRGMRDLPLPLYLLHLWSHDSWYRLLNDIILERQERFYPIVKAMVCGLTECHIASKFLYRGMDNVRVDESKEVYRFYTFSATTTSLETAKKFGTDVVFVIEVNRNTLGGSITHLSYFSTEDEVLLVPFQQFRVIRRERVDGRHWIYMTADSLDEVEEQELPEEAKVQDYHETVEIYVSFLLVLYALCAFLRKLVVIPMLIARNDYNTELQDFCRFEYTQSQWVRTTEWGDLRAQYRHLNRWKAVLKYVSVVWTLLWVSYYYAWLPTAYFHKARVSHNPFVSSMPGWFLALLDWMQRHSLLFRICTYLFVFFLLVGVVGVCWYLFR